MIGASVIASTSGTVQGPSAWSGREWRFCEEGAGSVSTRVTVYEHGKKADNPE
jgi:hypothetical protein